MNKREMATLVAGPVLATVLVGGGLVPGSAAASQVPPDGGKPTVTPQQVCGAGFKVVDSSNVWTKVPPKTTLAKDLVAKSYLLWNAKTGQNCVTTIKYSAIGKKTPVTAYLEVEGKKRQLDTGKFKLYAGPVKAAASGTCVKWGGTYSSLRSLNKDVFEHCGGQKPAPPPKKKTPQKPAPKGKKNLATIAAKYVGGEARRACADANIKYKHYQCKVFASCVSQLGNKTRVGGNYYNTYKQHGYVLVSKKDARPGDIIQLYKKGHTSSYYKGMHTAIVNGTFKGNTVSVIDSNFGGDRYGHEKVRRHNFNPFEREGKYGLKVAIWRFKG